MIDNIGEMEMKDFDDANIPVNVFIEKLDDDDEGYDEGFRYILRADNFMPRKNAASDGAVTVRSDNKEELQELVKKHVLPLYETAISMIKKIIDGSGDSFYYWHGGAD